MPAREAAASSEIAPTLFGPAGLETHGLALVETSESISMDDHAVDAVRAKTDSSLVRAVQAVADGDADVVVSAGNTGAMLAASLLHIRRLPGVHRPGIAIVIPTKRGPTVLIDAGANADARPEHLVQFAHMGSVFAEEILGIERPEVRLMSIGEEDEKGNQLTIDAHELLRAADLRFAGNMEGRLLLEGGADVVVADGFTGNVALKTLEGTIRTLLDALRTELGSSVRWEARRTAHQTRCEEAPRTPRPGDVRRRLPARPQRSRRHRARVELARRRRERDPSRRPRSRASGGRAAAGALVVRRVRVGALHDPDGREVRFQAWRLRVRRFSSRSKAR